MLERDEELLELNKSDLMIIWNAIDLSREYPENGEKTLCKIRVFL